MVEWKQSVRCDFVRYQTVTTPWCSFRPGDARQLKLRPFDSESKTTSGCSNRFIFEKNWIKKPLQSNVLWYDALEPIHLGKYGRIANNDRLHSYVSSHVNRNILSNLFANYKFDLNKFFV